MPKLKKETVGWALGPTIKRWLKSALSEPHTPRRLGQGPATKRRFIARLLIYSQLIQVAGAIAMPIPDTTNPNASYLLPTTYRPFQADVLPHAGLLTPLFTWAQTGHLNNLSLTSQQLGLTGPLTGGIHFSSLTGTFYEAQYFLPLSERLALNAIGEYGHGQYRLNGTAGYGLSPLAQLKFTAERLSQRLPFSFDSGDINARVHQDAYGLRFQQQFEHPFFQGINGGGYYAKAQNKNLAPIVFTSNGNNCAGYAAGLTCINYRHIAGATSTGFDWGAELLLTPSTLFGGNLYYDQVDYDTRLTGDGSHNSDGLGGGIKLNQLLGKRLKFSGEASVRKIYDSFQGSISWLPPLRDLGLELSLFGEHVISHNATPNNNSVNLQARWFPDGPQVYDERFHWKDKRFSEVGQWVKTPAVYMQQVLAIAEQITRLVAPSIGSISPNSGPFSGGNVVTISGSNFVAGLAVFFGGQLATAISVLSSTTLTAIVPAAVSMSGSPVVDVVIQNPDGQQTVLPRGYTYGGGDNLFASTPDDALHDAGQQATFTSTASGGIAPYRYQWQLSTDYGYNFANLPGETNPSYTTPTLTTEHNGYQYRLALLDSQGMGIVSQPAVLIVDAALITSKPADTNEVEGREARFDTVTDLGTLPYRYQWQVSRREAEDKNLLRGELAFKNIEGETAPFYITPPLEAADDGNQYRVVVMDAVEGSITSEAATLRVRKKSGKRRLEELARNEGQSITFTSKPDGPGPYRYQWQVKRSEGDFSDVIPSESGKEETYTIDPLKREDSGRYRVIITDATGDPITQDVANLVVNPVLVISEHPKERTVGTVGQQATLIVTADGGTKPYHYRWQVSTDGGDFSEFKDIPGASDSLSYITPTFTHEDTNSPKHYQVIVSDDTSAAVTSHPAVLIVYDVLTTTTPYNVTQNEGQKATFSTEPAGGNHHYHYQWQVRQVNEDAFRDVDSGTGKQEQTYVTAELTSNDHGNHYRVVVTDEEGNRVDSGEALLRVNGQLFIDEPPQETTNNVGQRATFVVRARGGSEPYHYHWQVSRGEDGNFVAAEEAADFFSYTTPELTSAEVDQPIYYRVQVTDSTGVASEPSQPVPLTVNPPLEVNLVTKELVQNENQQATLSATITGGTPNYTIQWQVKGREETDFQDVDSGTGNTSATTTTYTTGKLTAAGDHGNTYRVIIKDEAHDTAISDSAYLTVNAGELVTSKPEDIVGNEGQAASFYTKPSGGSPEYRYQWQVSRKGSPFEDLKENANEAYYELPELALNDNGNQYQVVVTDVTGVTTTSAQATLTVHSQLGAKPPQDSARNVNQQAVFETEAFDGTWPYEYQWQVSIDHGQNFANVTSGTDDMSDRYTTAALNAEDDGNRYRVIVRDKTGDEVIRGPATLRVNDKPITIITQPQGATQNEKQQAQFNVAAIEGIEPYHYQWQVSFRGSEQFTDAPDGDSSLPTYLTPLLDKDRDNESRYKVIVTDATGIWAVSEAALLLVHDGLAATTPADVVRNVGQMATFETSASGGTSPYHFHWQKKKRLDSDFTPIEGAQDLPMYTIPSLTSDDNGTQFRVAITDSKDDRINSSYATLTVHEKLAVTKPQSQVKNEGQSVLFEVEAQRGTGTAPYQHQWQVSRDGKEFNNIDGANAPVYAIYPLTINLHDGTYYRAVISDATPIDSVVSEVVTLKVNEKLTTSAPGTVTLDEGQTATFSTTAAKGTGSYRYQWQKQAKSETKFSNVLNAVQFTYKTPMLDKASDDGSQYRVVVTDEADDSVRSVVAQLTVNAKLETSKPDDQTKNEEQKATFKTTINEGKGTPEYYYQWQVSKDGTSFTDIAVDAKGPSYTTDKLKKTSDDGKTYKVIVTDEGGGRVEHTAKLTVNDKLTITLDNVTKHVDEKNVTFTPAVQGGSTSFTYQWYKAEEGTEDFVPISNDETSASYLIATLHKNDNGTRYKVVVTDTVAKESKESAPANLRVVDELTTTGLDAQTKNEGQAVEFTTEASHCLPACIYQWQVSSDEKEENFKPVPNADKFKELPSYKIDSVKQSDHNGKYYRVVVTDDIGGMVKSKPAKLTVRPQLSMKTPPNSQSRDLNKDANFSVKVEGGDTNHYTYQWQFQKGGSGDFTNISTSSSYPISSVKKNDAGNYRVIVSDGSGQSVGENLLARLTVSDILSVTGPDNVNTTEGEAATFTANPSGGTGNYSYSWYSGGDKIGAGKSYQIESVTVSAHNNTQYTVVVTDDGGGSETRGPATLKVTLALNVTLVPDSPSISKGGSVTFEARVSGGSGSQSYQWQQYVSDKWKNVGTNNYQFKTGSLSSDSQYQVVVNDNGRIATSNLESGYVTVTAPPIPSIDSLNPTHGPAGINTLVTIAGENLQNVNVVDFGGNTMRVESKNSKEVKAYSNAKAPAGTIKVYVVDSNREGSNELDFTYDEKTLPAVGSDLHDQGGKVGCRGENNMNIILASDRNVNPLQWSTQTKLLGANSVDDGQANTQTILDKDTGAVAAKYCTNLTTGGKKDWFLPAKKQLECLYSNKDLIFVNGDLIYWSSTENDAKTAIIQVQTLSISYFKGDGIYTSGGSHPIKIGISALCVRHIT